MVDQSAPSQPTTPHERVLALLDSIERALNEAVHDFRASNTLLLACDLQAIALWADDALGELDAIHDTGDLSAFRDFVVRKSGGKQSAR